MRRSFLALLLGTMATGAIPIPPTAEAVSPVANPAGDWIATLDIGTQLQIALHLKRDGAAWSASVDSPDQGAFDVPASNVVVDGDKLSFDVARAAGHYSGAWDAARQLYAGIWSQQGQTRPLDFARGQYRPPAVSVDWSTPPVAGLDYTPGPIAKATKGPTLPVGKCINMSDMLEAPTEGAWGPAIAEDDFRIVRAAGFATVRIPVRWSAHALATAPYTIDPAFLQRVHHVVDLATASKLNVILNMHNYDELYASPSANAARFAALWRQIGASFASAPRSVWFELINEPNDNLTSVNLPSILAPALAAVRATNPTRPVVIGGENWSGLHSLETLTLPDDPYVVPTFHYYEPFAFTHQGALWVKPPPPFGRPYGTAADKALLDKDVAQVRAYAARTGRVPILGEYGAQDDPRLPVAQRIRYYHAISSAFASAGIQSCAWGYRTGFRLRNGDQWIPGLIEAIVAPTIR